MSKLSSAKMRQRKLILLTHQLDYRKQHQPKHYQLIERRSGESPASLYKNRRIQTQRIKNSARRLSAQTSRYAHVRVSQEKSAILKKNLTRKKYAVTKNKRARLSQRRLYNLTQKKISQQQDKKSYVGYKGYEEKTVIHPYSNLSISSNHRSFPLLDSKRKISLYGKQRLNNQTKQPKINKKSAQTTPSNTSPIGKKNTSKASALKGKKAANIPKFDIFFSKKEKLQAKISRKKEKLDHQLKKRKAKGMLKGKLTEKTIDKIGRDADGNLNLIGIILVLIILIPILANVLLLICLLSVILAIIAIILAVWSFISGLFTIKTEDVNMTQAYELVTKMDAEMNRTIQNELNRLKVENDQVVFSINGFETQGDQFIFSSEADSYIYYLNAKYEDYNIYRSIEPSENIFGVNSVRKEIIKTHEMTYNYNVEVKKDQPVEVTHVVKDPETGEEKEETVTEHQDIAYLKVTAKTLGQFLDEHSASLSEAARDKFRPIQDLDRFEDKVFLESPLGKGVPTRVTERYGYRGTDTSKIHRTITIPTPAGTPIYAPVNGTLEDWFDDQHYIMYEDNWGSTGKEIYYHNVDIAKGVEEGDEMSKGEKIAVTRGNLELSIDQEQPLFMKDDPVYPAAFVKNLEFDYPGSLKANNRSGLIGDLAYPTQQMSEKHSLVVNECKKYGLEEYVGLLEAIMMVESNGKGGDVMQVSESLGMAKNTIKDPKKSIQEAVKYFHELKEKAEALHLDLPSIVQAYNFGSGFLDYLSETNSSYSFELAKTYARNQSDSERTPYTNDIAERLGYDWRYSYGNMFYVPLVRSMLSSVSSKTIDIANDEIGSNGKKYWQWYGFKNRVDWCAIFVSWVAEQSGQIAEGKMIQSANCSELINWFNTNNKYHKNDKKYTPQVGDLVFFDWNGEGTGKDHVGIVEYNDGTIIQTIEGNSDDQVKRNTYPLDTKVISGFGQTSK